MNIVILGFGVPKNAIVATATAIALTVDAAGVPVYLVTQGYEIMPQVQPQLARQP